jgi:hypothetical protein
MAHGITSQHQHIPRRLGSHAGSSGYLSIADGEVHPVGIVILSHSQCFVHASLRLTLPHRTFSPRHPSLSLTPLLFAHLLVPDRLLYLSHCVCYFFALDFSCQPITTPLATARMPKKKGGKVQGRAKQKVKAQNASAAPGSKPAWMKKFAKSFDDGTVAPAIPPHANSAPAFHSTPGVNC